jgi:hypothetical protein
MRKLLNNPWLVGSLCLAVPLVAGRALLRSGDGAYPARPEVPVGSEPVRIADEIPAGSAAAGTIDPSWRSLPVAAASRDPFAARARGPAPAGATETVQLSAIWTENGATLVLLNHQMLRPGDKIGRWQIESATQEGVWITRGLGRHFLALGETVSVSAGAAEPL